MSTRRKLAFGHSGLAVVLSIAAFILPIMAPGVAAPSAACSNESGLSEQGIPASEIFNAPCMMPAMIEQASDDAVDGVSSEGAQGAPPVRARAAKVGTEFDDVQPIRSLVDPYPSFNGIAFDPTNDIVLMSDTNKKSLLVYPRTSGGHAREEAQPARQIIGPATNIGFIAGVAIDSTNRELFAVNNDIEDRVVVFPSEDQGNVKPKRILHVPYSSWGLALNQRRDELAVSVQQINAVIIYRREAKGLEAPVRSIIGANTGLADPHGICWDESKDEIFVSDHGNANKEGTSLSTTDYYNSDARLQLSLGGEFQAPAVHVFAGSGQGNVKALRTIQGPSTQLNWPTGMAVDTIHDQLAVANSADNSVLFFRRSDSGNVRPVRMLKGTQTGIDRPMGVAIDRKNNELWVANFGDHTALVFDLKASGNAAPKRIVRNAPQGTPSAGFGNPMALAFDTSRDEIVVGN